MQVGDLVGLHYPHQCGTLLGCAGSKCENATYPGFPSASDGFANNERLYIYLAEVFKIYMKGKTEGTIQSGRAFALYCLSNQKLGCHRIWYHGEDQLLGNCASSYCYQIRFLCL